MYQSFSNPIFLKYDKYQKYQNDKYFKISMYLISLKY